MKGPQGRQGLDLAKGSEQVVSLSPHPSLDN